MFKRLCLITLQGLLPLEESRKTVGGAVLSFFFPLIQVYIVFFPMSSNAQTAHHISVQTTESEAIPRRTMRGLISKATERDIGVSPNRSLRLFTVQHFQARSSPESAYIASVFHLGKSLLFAIEIFAKCKRQFMYLIGWAGFTFRSRDPTYKANKQ